MQRHSRIIAISGIFLLLASTAAAADPDRPPVQQVQVSGARAGQRQRETVTSIVVEHADIVRNGDEVLSDVLKRLPGISIDGVPGQGGAIRMRGLSKGYTQIMLNGEPVAAGFTLDSIAPDLIERIEIMRSATSDQSNQAIAGTINIVLKKTAVRGQRTLSAGASRQNGRTSPSLAAQLSDRTPAFTYSLAATLSRKTMTMPSTEWEEMRDPGGQLSLQRSTPQTEYGRTDALSLAPRINWQLDGGDTLAWQGFADLRHIDRSRDADETALIGGHSEFPHSTERYLANASMLRSDVNWTHLLEDSAKLDFKMAMNRSRRSAEFNFIGEDASLQQAGRHHVDSGPAETSYTTSGSYRRPYAENHAVALGWDASRALRDEYRDERLYDAAGAPAGGSDADYSATVKRLALFAQDEWDVTPRWSLYLGLRHEYLSTVSTANTGSPLESSASVWSPALQSRYKLAEKDLLRFALSRTYKAPALASLVPRRYTNDNNNNPTNPDEQGNPNLRPELAWGLDAAYEHYLGDGALLSASTYLRRISDVTVTRLFQQDGEWLETPVNDGNASVRGIELEAKLPLSALFAHAPALDLRANLARNWSSVDRIAGPNNRLENQMPFSANLGMDYKLPTAPVTMGGNLNYQAGGPVRLSPQLDNTSNPKREFDLYAAWKAAPKTQWRIAASNLLRQQHSELRDYVDASGTLRRITLTPTSATLRITLESQF